VESTASAGNIMKGATPFIHNYGQNNTFIGENAGNLSMTGYNNTVSGSLALSHNSTGSQNVVSGSEALRLNESGSDNVAIGVRALWFNNSGSLNVAIGRDALGSNFGGSYNTANGTTALYGNTTGNNNTAVGDGALANNSTANDNTAVGGQALTVNTTGATNTAIGAKALLSNTTGSQNIAIGQNAGSLATTGSNNVHIGAVGLATDASVIRIGEVGTQQSAYVAGVYDPTGSGSGMPVVIDSTGKLSTANIVGTQGPPGPAGPQGPAGPAGATGPAGPAGPQGPAGATGATGATGPAGTQGPLGPAGATGPVGPQGPAGANGNSVLNGAGAPPLSAGVTGDFYIDTTANAIYGPKAGSWPTGVSLVGPTGPQGPQGATGATGPQGIQGIQGPPGPAGGTNFVRTIVVGPVGTSTANGTALRNALANIASPSSSNPWLLKVEPGIYDLGATPLSMREYVDIEGSGQFITTILAEGYGAVSGANNAELRQLTITNNGNGGGAFVTTAVQALNSSPRLTDVTLNVSGSGDTVYGIEFSQSSLPIVLTRVTIRVASGPSGFTGGIYNYLTTGSAVFQNVDVKLTGSGCCLMGIFNNAPASVTVRDSSVDGGNGTGIRSSPLSSLNVAITNSTITGAAAALQSDAGVTNLISATQLSGILSGGGTNKCVGAYNANFIALGSACN
jgi:hypothetical protein